MHTFFASFFCAMIVTVAGTVSVCLYNLYGFWPFLIFDLLATLITGFTIYFI